MHAEEEASTDDGMESAAIESVQGYAGSESSALSKAVNDGTSPPTQLPLHSDSSSASDVEYEADDTSSHLAAAPDAADILRLGLPEAFFFPSKL